MNPEPSSWIERLSHALLGEPEDRGALLALLQESQKRGLLNAQALKIIENVLQISDQHVEDIMIPRSQMVVIEKNTPLEAILPLVIESAHSRFPVIGDTKDEVIGILLAKDLLPYAHHHHAFNIQDILRPAMLVPESNRLDILLGEFQRTHQHLAVVIDEYSSVVGLVTIEDVIEEIIGEIEDEHDTQDDHFIRAMQGPEEYSVQATTPLKVFNAFFKAEFDEAACDTIAGFVVQQLGRIPKRDDVLTLGPIHITVLRADSRRVALLKVKRDLL